MRILLDTHALLWWFFDAEELPGTVRRLVRDRGTNVLVSSASAWEIAIKYALGRLAEAGEAVTRFPQLLVAAAMEELPMTVEHVLVAGSLPGPHRDPFDRMLIAQSRIEGLPVATRDGVFAEYGVEVVWE